MSVTAILGSRRGTQPTAGIATNLVITTQPSGAANGVAFTTQPVVEVRDGLGDLVAGSSIAITVAKASGSGTLSGDTEVNASSGVATFTDLVITGTGDHQLTFTATGLTGTTSSTFDVSDGSGVAALFESDWSTATGTGENALSDGGKWNFITDASGPHEVIAATGLGFPAGMTNVYRVPNPGNSMHVGIQDGWALPAIGGSIYFRYYMRAAIDGVSGANNWHSPQSNAAVPSWASGISWAVLPNTSATGFWFKASMNDGTESRWRMESSAGVPNTVPKDDVYRIEMQFLREADTTWRWRFRMYDSAGDLVRQTSDFWNGVHTVQFSDALNVIVGDGEDPNLLRGICFGTNGGLAETGYMYYGGVCVRNDDWCGAY